MFITSENLAAGDIAHGFFGRRGGVSTGLYDNLNCGLGTDDDPEAVRENRRRAMEALNVRPESLVTLYQIHSADCITRPSPSVGEGGGRPKGDAMVTDQPGLALGILTADCAPILFKGRKKTGAPVIGAAHAGWKGALGGVLENTVAAMRELGAEDISAAIGPCIARDSYEVSADFMTPFLAQDQSNVRFFTPGKNDRVRHFDLAGYVTERLKAAGVGAFAAGADTYKQKDQYFSYRRTTHRKEPDYGRQISMIGIKDS
jgi:YfiH family protein